VKLFNENGQRKYLNAVERKAFKSAAEKQPREVRTFCLVIYYTGCRISEALALTSERIDWEENTITIKKLRRCFRLGKMRMVGIK